MKNIENKIFKVLGKRIKGLIYRRTCDVVKKELRERTNSEVVVETLTELENEICSQIQINVLNIKFENKSTTNQVLLQIYGELYNESNRK